MTGVDRASWVPVLEKMLSDLKALTAYLRGEIEHGEYCKRVGIADSSRAGRVVTAAVKATNSEVADLRRELENP